MTRIDSTRTTRPPVSQTCNQTNRWCESQIDLFFFLVEVLQSGFHSGLFQLVVDLLVEQR